MLWKAEANGKYFQFLNQWSAESEKVAVKYLRIENTRVDGDTFKTANANYKSNFSYTPKSGLTGFNNGTTTGTQYRVRFENNKFASGNSSSGDNIVPFVLKNTPDIYEITITNTPEYEVELPETGSTGRFFTHWEEFC